MSCQSSHRFASSKSDRREAPGADADAGAAVRGARASTSMQGVVPGVGPVVGPPVCLGVCLGVCLAVWLVWGTAVVGPCFAEEGSAKPTLSFDRYEFPSGSGKGQTVLAGRFLGAETEEIAVLWGDDAGRITMRLYAFESSDAGGSWHQALETVLGSDVAFVDVAEIGGRDRLLLYRKGRVYWFDPQDQTQRSLAAIWARYSPEHDLEGSPLLPGGKPPHVDVTRDLNRDGLDDLVVPRPDGFRISIQASDGSFSEAVTLGPPEPFRDEPLGKMDPGAGEKRPDRTYGDVGITASNIPIYLSRVHSLDYDRDGRADLVFWNEDHFEVYLQREDGRFAKRPKEFPPGVPFESEGVYSYAFEFRGRGIASIFLGVGKKVGRTVLHSLRDFDGDGVADLMTLTLSGRSITKQRSVYEVHFGSPTPDGTVFGERGSASIRPSGRGGGMEPWGYSSRSFEDFDGDGRPEALFRDVRVGLGGMARAIVGNSVPLDLELFHNQGSSFGERPAVRHRLRRFAPFAGFGNVFFPPVLVGDVNGDQRRDLLIGRRPGELHVFAGEPSSALLAKRPVKVAVELPSDERRVWLADLNRDGKQDVVVERGATDRNPEEPHRLITLIAR